MNRFKFEAMVEEFPFLPEAFGKRESQWCFTLTVKRVTPELLNVTPRTDEHEGSLVGIWEGDEVYLIADNKAYQVQAAWDFDSNFAHTDRRWGPGETLLEACARYEVHPDYIVWIEFGLGIENHYSTKEWKATIYKPGRDISIAGTIAVARSKARREVGVEVAF